jgi:hypothetical protein
MNIYCPHGLPSGEACSECLRLVLGGTRPQPQDIGPVSTAALDRFAKPTNCPHGATARDPDGSWQCAACQETLTDCPLCPDPNEARDALDPNEARDALEIIATALGTARCKHGNTTNRPAGSPRMDRMWCIDCGAILLPGGEWWSPRYVEVLKRIDGAK